MPNVKSHRIPEWERALIKWLMVKIRVNHDYGAAQGLGAGFHEKVVKFYIQKFIFAILSGFYFDLSE